MTNRMIAGCLMAAAATLAATAASAEPSARGTAAAAPATRAGIPEQLTAEQATGYRTVFAALRDGRWSDAQIALDAMPPGPLHAYARAELYTAKGSPKTAGDAALRLLAEAPELPQGEALLRIARARDRRRPARAAGRAAADLAGRRPRPRPCQGDQERSDRGRPRHEDAAVHQG